MSLLDPTKKDLLDNTVSSGGIKSTIFPFIISNPDPGAFLKSTVDIMSFYSPIIIIFGVFILSVFSSSVSKAFVFLFWFFVVTGARALISKISGSSATQPKGDSVCSIGVFTPFIPNTNLTYSTFSIAFTMFYFIFPMILLNNDNKSHLFNYRIILFFIFYIVFDLLIKRSRQCLAILTPTIILSDFVGGISAGIVSSSIMYYLARNYLFINEAAPNAEVCSMPSKQRFKCSVYKNGELVSSSVN